MKCAFIYGNADFYQESTGTYYSGGTVSVSLWEKYLNYFEDIVAVGREMKNPSSMKFMTNVSHPNVEIVMIPSLAGAKQILKNKKEVVKACQQVLKRVDCAIIRLPSVTGIIACKEAERLKVPYMVEVVGCVNDALKYHGSLKGKIAAKPLSYLNKYSIKNAPFVSYVTKEFLQERYPTKGVACACSDVSIINVNTGNLEIRKRRIDNEFHGKKIKIGVIGSLNVDYKGHKYIINALGHLKGKLDFEIHFLGSGDPGRWKKLADSLGIEEAVFFDGTLPSGQKVFEWMDDLDLFITPSLTEGLPRALVEAMSRGLPCIASNVGGIPELLESEFLYSPTNYKSLSEKILLLLSNKEELLKCSDRNFNKAKEYSEENLNQIRNSFYKEFISTINKL